MLATFAAVAVCVLVDGDRITAGDLARSVPEFHGIAAETELAHAPAPWVKRIFAQSELQRLAEREGLTIDAPAELCVERVAQQLNAESVMTVMQAALHIENARIEVLKLSRSVVPKGTIEFPVSGLRSVSEQSDIARWYGRVVYEGRTLPVWALVRIRAKSTRLVAKADLRPGTPLSVNDLAIEQCEGVAYLSAPTKPGDVVGLVPRKSISAGSVISTELLDHPVEIARGDEVMVSTSRDGIVLRVSGIAETPGKRGEQIMIRNATSGKRFRARVQGKGLASL